MCVRVHLDWAIKVGRASKTILKKKEERERYFDCTLTRGEALERDEAAASLFFFSPSL